MHGFGVLIHDLRVAFNLGRRLIVLPTMRVLLVGGYDGGIRTTILVGDWLVSMAYLGWEHVLGFSDVFRGAWRADHHTFLTVL